APPPLFPPEDRAFIGVTTKEGTYDFAPVDRFGKAIRHRPAVMLFNHGWAVNETFDRAEFDAVARRGMLPMLSWEPWNYRDDRKNADGTHARQPRYQLNTIYGGAHDDYIRAYATGIRRLNYRVAIRFAHEMNGFWYPWGADVNGNAAGDYVKAWRHVRQVFTEVGATNVIWVWSPNVLFGDTQLKPFYPGDEWVDWIGLSGYYGTEGTENYRSPRTVFGRSITHLRTFTSKPLVITETAATDNAGLKARWVREFFGYLEDNPDIIGFIWYESVKEWDWRIATAPAASAAFAAEADDRRYDVRWATNVVPRVTAKVPPRPTGSPVEPTGTARPR
ncbi:glycoside hydrolase family 26 protein, partial [Micromonospora echinofusca]